MLVWEIGKRVNILTIVFGIQINNQLYNPMISLIVSGLSPLYRVAVVGNVDAGKSTLLGVLTHGELDNGRGTARQRLFRHKHEMESGRTSSVGNDILGFDSGGRVVNKPDHGNLDWVKICEQSSKVSFLSKF